MFQTLPCKPGEQGVRLMLMVGALLSASASHAQTTHDHSRVSSSPPTAAATPLKFESTMLRYKPMTDQKLGSWRDANDTVTRIGGWRTYLKEAQTPDARTTTPAAAPAAPAMPAVANPHAGHGAKP